MTQVSKSSMNSLSASSIDSVSSSALRSSTIESSADSSPDSEVIQIATRRQFSASEKRMLLAEADRCKERGELGAFLRRKHIYSSMLSSWRKQLGAADSAALAPQKRGPKPDAAARQIKHLNRDVARLRHKLERAELIIEAQKNCAWRSACRPRTRRAGTSDARRQRSGPSRRYASGLQGVRLQPWVCVSRSRAAAWGVLSPPHIGEAAAAAGSVHRRAAILARRARQRTLCRHSAGDDLCHIAR